MNGPASTTNAYSARRLAGLVLGPVLAMALLAFPAPADMEAGAWPMAAVATLMAVWWITDAVPIPVTALVPIFAYPALGIMSTREAAPNYTNQLVFLFLGGFLIAAALVKWNLHKRIALHTIRIVGTGPTRMVLGFMLATAFLSMWISNTATAVMMLPIAMAVVNQLADGARCKGVDPEQAGDEVRRALGTSLLLGIAYSASIGGIGTLIGTPPNGVFVGQVSRLYGDAAPDISFSTWILVGLPVVFIMLPLAWQVVLRIGPHRRLSDLSFSVGGGSVIREQLRALGPMSFGERATALVFGCTAFLWLFRTPIDLGLLVVPGWSSLFADPGLFSDATIAVGMGSLLFIIPANPAEFSLSKRRRENFLLDWRTAQSSVPWGILLLFGGGFALAHGFSASGLSSWVGSRMTALSGLPIILVIAVLCLVMTFLTEMTSNTATTTLLLPILALAAIDMGQHPFLLMIPATMSASCAFMLPVATPPNAIVFGSGWLTVPRMSRTGLILNLLGVVVITFLTLSIVVSVYGITLGHVPAWASALQ